MRALNIAATGMAAQNMRVEVISHNLANMSTTAYNARRAEFSDLHYQQVQRPGTINSADGTVLPAGVQLGLGVRAAAVSMQVEQGALTETGGSLDLAIEGQGYLEVTLPNGDPAYTRDGALKRNGDGLIVTSDGFAVVPDITVPEDAREISINAHGEVYAYFDGQTDAQLLGQFTLTSASRTRRASRRWARTSTARPRPRARPTSAMPARTGAAPSARATWRIPASTRCTRSPG